MKFKLFYNKQLLLEGGVAGHLVHPFEVLTPTKFIQFYKDLFAGKFSAYEKVDGVNLVVGYNNKGQLVFSRNITENPSTDINAKFPIKHPGGDAFRAGFKALQKGLEGLSKADRIKYKLIDASGNPLRFLNLEIIYGAIPNIVQYSDTTNYIVFHGYFDLPINDYKKIIDPEATKLLNDLANQLKTIEIESDVVSYYGVPGSVEMVSKPEKSKWTFKGPISISSDKIKNNLKVAAQEFQEIPELKKLVSGEVKDKETQFELMKIIADKIGGKILRGITSELFSGKKLTGDEFPNIEGMVIHHPKLGMLKITGEFRDLNQKLWGPLREDMKVLMDNFSTVILNQVGIYGITTLRQMDIKKAGGIDKYLEKKGVKGLNDPFNKDIVQKAIDSTLLTLRKKVESADKELKDNIKKNDIVKNYQITALSLQEFQEAIKNIKTKKELFNAFTKVFT